ncbi:type VI secretion system Vgr family protein [candidate division CSSED10-310 bacterium]|uniref:Type VI secretion system Vgr family protein n=1 Tax=candidate division CSSED10-310 bacterium TaxID=2855610 RepID=A0ABV6Z0T9_UNCC1
MVEYRYNEPYYTLQFSELDEDVVRVHSFEGEENISRLFEYRFHLLSEEAELDPESILNKKATFSITRGEDDPINIYGIISHFEQRGRSPDYVSYFAVLVPRMWWTNLTYRSEVFQEMDIQQIITLVLENSGLSAGEDFEFSLSESYPEMEFVVQYRETNFNFINHRLEHFGICYYFDHSNDTDKIVFCDCNDELPAIEQDDDIFYNPNKDPLSESETVSEIIYQGKVVTGLTQLKDYNYRFPSTQLLVESQIDPDAPGTFYNYGDHYKSVNEGEFLARVRNEEILCNSKKYVGMSDCRLFRAGHKFTMGQHYREDWNAEYILTKVVSRGNQAGLFGILQTSKEIIPTFENYFETIPPDLAYRPSRITQKPKIYGIMNAKIDAGGEGDYAEIDDEGRYKVVIPFDLSGRTDGQASRFIRMAQPYAGAGYGMHFPLHKDTEVLLTFVDGDPDRPIIAGSIPNPETMSPITSGNQTQSIIRTGGGNQIAIEDSDGGQQIALTSPTENTKISIGAPNQGNIFLSTAGSMFSSIEGPQETQVHGTYTKDIDSEVKITYRADVLRKTIGSTNEEFVGTKTSKSFADTHEEFVGSKTSKSLADTTEEFVGLKSSKSYAVTDETFMGVKNSKNLAATNELFAGVKMSNQAAATIENFYGIKVSACAAKKWEKSGSLLLQESPITEVKGVTKIELDCSGASITITPSEIKLKASKVVIDASDTIVNNDCTIQKDTRIQKSLIIGKDLAVDGKIHNANFKSSK